MKDRQPATEWPPPRRIPRSLFQNFTQNGEMPLKKYKYFKQKYSGTTALVAQWTPRLVSKMKKRHLKHKRIGGYTLRQEDLIVKALQKYPINGQIGAVIGSENPWVEAILLARGADSVITIEYGAINSTVPEIITFLPDEFASKELNSTFLFDFVITVSSIEHSGLGRYGDALDPDGDIEAMDEIYCMLKPNGYLYLALPYTKKSHIVWNEARHYGPERMKMIAKNFKQIDYFGKLWREQGVFVLQK